MKYIVGLLFLLFAISCKSPSANNEELTPNTPQDTIEIQELFAALENGEVFFKNKNPFGDDIKLTGENKIADTVIFKVNGTESLTKDGFLVMKNGYRGAPFTIFGLDNLNFVAHSGRFGQGPGEFTYPTLVPSTEQGILCYVYESTNGKLYSLRKDGVLEDYPFDFGRASMKYSARSVANIAPKDFIYSENTIKGKSIFRAKSEGDSVTIKEVYNLALNPKRKSWMAYTGDFVVNAQKNRMAYAYKYFKIIKFMDIEAGTVRTVNFEKEEWDETTEYKLDGMDANVTHYWGATTTDDYVYFMYSGRTPAQVVAEGQKGTHYIFVEKYDWNGTPIARYRLDRWGYFTVDGKSNKLYLISTDDDGPFFIYDLNQDKQ